MPLSSNDFTVEDESILVEKKSKTVNFDIEKVFVPKWNNGIQSYYVPEMREFAKQLGYTGSGTNKGDYVKFLQEYYYS